MLPARNPRRGRPRRSSPPAPAFSRVCCVTMSLATGSTAATGTRIGPALTGVGVAAHRLGRPAADDADSEEHGRQHHATPAPKAARRPVLRLTGVSVRGCAILQNLQSVFARSNEYGCVGPAEVAPRQACANRTGAGKRRRRRRVARKRARPIRPAIKGFLCLGLSLCVAPHIRRIDVCCKPAPPHCRRRHRRRRGDASHHYLLGPGTSSASSHREAPLIAGLPQLDNTDLYAFRSPSNDGTVTLISNWIPFESSERRPELLPVLQQRQVRHQHRQQR